MSTSCSSTGSRCATTTRAASARCCGSPDTAERHPLLRRLGPEPLDGTFDADYLWKATRGRRAAIKLALMDNHVVVGVGNIYANEALFRAGIRPTTPAGRLSRPRLSRLVDETRDVLTEAIAKGGSTLRDYVDATGEPGYFQLDYYVYGRAGLAVPPLRDARQTDPSRASARPTIARAASADAPAQHPKVLSAQRLGRAAARSSDGGILPMTRAFVMLCHAHKKVKTPAECIHPAILPLDSKPTATGAAGSPTASRASTTGCDARSSRTPRSTSRSRRSPSGCTRTSSSSRSSPSSRAASPSSSTRSSSPISARGCCRPRRAARRCARPSSCTIRRARRRSACCRSRRARATRRSPSSRTTPTSGRRSRSTCRRRRRWPKRWRACRR